MATRLKLLAALLFLSVPFCRASTPQVILSGSSANLAVGFGLMQGTESLLPYNSTESNQTEIDPQGGTWSNLYVNLTVAPGTGNSWTFAFRTNGTDAPLTCTISNAATSCTDVLDSSTTAAGDIVDMHVTNSGTPATTKATYTTQYIPSVDNNFILMGNSGTSSTGLAALSGLDTFQSIASALTITPEACTMKNLYVNAAGAPGGGNSYTIAFIDGGGSVGSSLACTISGASATTCNDISHSSTTIAGDVVNLIDNNGGSPLSVRASWGIVCSASVSGQFPFLAKQQTGVTTATDFVYGHGGRCTLNATEAPTKAVFSAPSGGLTLGNLYVASVNAPGAGTSRAWTLRKNGTSPVSGTTCTVSGTAKSCSDLSNTVSVANSDLINFQFAPTGTPANSGLQAWAFTGTVVAPAGTNTSSFFQLFP